ncbi:hypothetical protein T484DRAFT_1839174 [Baffinella frigidus]|nr:hypothetical protein T484DRAFT_1839174 [Cryptophyta sp. CCMP2293]
MCKLGVVHPPALAVGVMYMTAYQDNPAIANLGWLYIVLPILFDTLFLLV